MMKTRSHYTAQPHLLASFAFALAVIVFIAISCLALSPRAYAATGDVLGYAYLDLDENGDQTALVVRDTPRTDAEIELCGCRDLGKLIDGQTPPWEAGDGDRGDIVTARFETANPDTRISPTSTAYWFDGCENLKSIELSSLDTSNVTNMEAMFSSCSSLISLDLSTLDASNVTGMGGMFFGCSSLESLDLSSLDTSNARSMRSMFASCSSLSSLDLSTFDTSNVTNMGSMFLDCSSLKTLNLSSFDTSNVADMSYMFCRCSSLISLDISSFDTSNVTNMSNMFSNCSSLKALSLPSFDSANVVNMGWMFSGCKSLVSLELSSLDTSNVQNMYGMFSNCSSLTSLDLSSFDTSSAQNMGGMFADCPSLKSLDLSSFDTSNATDMSAMFGGCPKLAKVTIGVGFKAGSAETYFPSGEWTLEDDSSVEFASLDDMLAYVETAGQPITFVVNIALSGVNGTCIWAIDEEGALTISPAQGGEGALDPGIASVSPWGNAAELVTSARFEGIVHAVGYCNLFYGCPYLESVDLSGLDTSHVASLDGMFSGCSSLKSLDLSSLDTSNVASMHNLLSGCSSLESLNLSTLETSNVTDMGSMFDGCASLASLDLSSFDTSRATTMRGLFSNCSKLGSLNLSTFDTSNVTDMGWLFNGCSSLAFLDLSSFETSNVKIMNYMFYGCRSLESLDLSSFDTSSAKYMGGMFSCCLLFESLDLSSFDTSNVVNMSGMFWDCPSLASLDLSSFDTSNTKDMGDMFHGCSSLTSLGLSSFDTSSVLDMGGMFACCSSLESLDLSSFDTSSVTDMLHAFVECGHLRNLQLGKSTVLTPDAELDGMWISSADGHAYRLCDAPAGVEASYARVTRTEPATYAVLGSDGALFISQNEPDWGGSAEIYVLSEFGYGSAEEVPWHSRRADIASVVSSEAGAFDGLAFWFDGCANLRTADLSGVRVAIGADLTAAFRNCAALEGVELPEISAAVLDEAFRNCASLLELDLSGASTRQAASMRRMLHGCTSLKTVKLGQHFTFRGKAPRRLPGGELPSGAWASSAEPGVAYLSDSLPSFEAATYTRLTDGELESGGYRVVSTAVETDEGKPQLTVTSELTADGTEVLSYEVGEDYPGDELFVGGSPRASALELSARRVDQATVVREVSSKGGVALAHLYPSVAAVSPRAFAKAPSVRTLRVWSGKLTTRARVHNCLAGSNVSTVDVRISGAKKAKVKSAFANYSGKKSVKTK